MTDRATPVPQCHAPSRSARTAERRRRQRLLTILQWTFGAVAVVYLTLHVTVTVKAYAASGLVAAAATLVTLGIGDLWWSVAAWRTGDHLALAIAGTAAMVAFTSWATRGWTNQMMIRLALADLGDLGAEIERLEQETGTRDDSATRPPD